MSTSKPKAKAGARPTRTQKLSPEQRVSVAAYHEQAYRTGRNLAIQMLEIVVGMKSARHDLFEGIGRDRFQPDMMFIRGFLDATVPLLEDTVPMMRTGFGVALQEAILDDFFDNAERTLRKIKERPFDRFPRF